MAYLPRDDLLSGVLTTFSIRTEYYDMMNIFNVNDNSNLKDIIIGIESRG